MTCVQHVPCVAIFFLLRKKEENLLLADVFRMRFSCVNFILIWWGFKGGSFSLTKNPKKKKKTKD